jgi:putative ABC transport system substrate-binding protein
MGHICACLTLSRWYHSRLPSLGWQLGSLVARFLILSLLTTGLSVKSTLAATEIPILIPQNHPVIQEIIDGINKGFEEHGYISRGYETKVFDSQGVPANIGTMIDACIEKHPPILISITTGLSKLTVDKALGRIPVVFSGVTDPVGGAIVPDLVKHGDVTGASDLWPVEDQLRLIKRILGSGKRVGVIFRSSEPNSLFGMRIAREAAKKLDLTLVERSIEDQRELVAVLDAILPKVDAIYIGPDNMTIESAKVIAESSLQARKPVFGGEPGTLEKGAVGIVSIRYFDLGKETARLATKILDGAKAKDIPVYVASNGFVGLNYDAAKRLNLAIPKEVRDSAEKTIGTYEEPSTVQSLANHLWIVIMALAVVAIIIGIAILRKRSASKT